MAKQTNKPKLLIVVAKGAFASGGGNQLVQEAGDEFAKLGAMLSDASKNFLEKVRENAPTTIELSLGLELEAGGNWLVVSGKATANVTVTLTWERDGS